jgi:hypothetical protein
MPSFGDVVGRVETNVRMRVDSATKAFPDDFRQHGIVPALIALGSRFGRANRALIGR